MMCRRAAPLLLALLTVAPPSALAADDCGSSPGSGVRLSVSSARNVTGHWLTTVALTRTTSRDADGLWYDERPMQYDVDITRRSCGDEETLTTTFHVVAPPPRVGSDYSFFRGVGYYKLHTDMMTWEDARRTCAKEGAHLAVMNSEAEENAIRELMRLQPNETKAFIGFHDRFKEGEYITVLGDLLNSTGRVNWAKNEPNNGGGSEAEDCGNIYFDGTINDARCSLKLLFVCEQGL